MAELIVILALGIIALGAISYPLIAGRSRYRDEAELEADVARYRAAVAAGTVCSRCRAANEEGSRFCAECGQPLGHGP